LVCGHLPDDYVAALGGGFPEVFTRLFDIDGVDAEIVPYSVVDGEFPHDIESVDGWITTGSPHSVYDDEPWIHRFADLVRVMHETVPFVGICFGHQMIAHALGGAVGAAKNGWNVGIQSAHVVEREPWMDPLLGSVRLLSSHRDQIQILPPDGVVLAGSPHCPIGMFRVGDAMLGIQGHPEFTRGFVDRLLVERADQAESRVIAQARAGLDGPTDAATVAKWITRFVSG